MAAWSIVEAADMKLAKWPTEKLMSYFSTFALKRGLPFYNIAGYGTLILVIVKHVKPL